MKFSPLALVLCLASVSCTASHSQEKSMTDVVSANDKVECESSEAPTGSHMVRRRCVTKEQKRQEEKDAQEFLSRLPGPEAPKNSSVGP
jgi:hypothetical protein